MRGLSYRSWQLTQQILHDSCLLAGRVRRAFMRCAHAVDVSSWNDANGMRRLQTLRTCLQTSSSMDVTKAGALIHSPTIITRMHTTFECSGPQTRPAPSPMEPFPPRLTVVRTIAAPYPSSSSVDHNIAWCTARGMGPGEPTLFLHTSTTMSSRSTHRLHGGVPRASAIRAYGAVCGSTTRC